MSRTYRITRTYDVTIQADDWEAEATEALKAHTDVDTADMKVEELLEVATYGIDGGDLEGELVFIIDSEGTIQIVDPDDVSADDTVIIGPFSYRGDLNDSETDMYTLDGDVQRAD